MGDERKILPIRNSKLKAVKISVIIITVSLLKMEVEPTLETFCTWLYVTVQTLSNTAVL
jgi:hypothetical protein